MAETGGAGQAESCLTSQCASCALPSPLTTGLERDRGTT